MKGPLRKLFSAVALLLVLALALSACGGSSSSSGSSSSAALSSSSASEPASSAAPSLGSDSGEVVAKVGSTPITKAQVSHWMGTLAGGDYYELSRKHEVPAGLVSDPPRYSACVSQLEASSAAAPRKLYELSGVQLLTKCRELYQALRTQAIAFLVHALYVPGLASDFGITVSDQEVRQFYKKSTAERFPSEAANESYLKDRRASLSDELLVAKLDLISQKTLTKVKAPGSGGLPALSRSEARWKAMTDCKAGYVVEYCKQFTGEAPHTAANPPASVLMEQVAALVTGRCTNLAACGKAQ
jgi:hypothetical protein